MARQVRIESTGAFHHVMARGNHLEPIFHSEDASDQELFLKTLDALASRREEVKTVGSLYETTPMP